MFRWTKRETDEELAFPRCSLYSEHVCSCTPPSSSLRARSYYFQAGKQKLLKVKYHSQSSVARERPGSNSKVKGKVLVLCRTGTSPSAPRHLSSPGQNAPEMTKPWQGATLAHFLFNQLGLLCFVRDIDKSLRLCHSVCP